MARNFKKVGNANPCITQKFNEDSCVMVYNGRIYVYSTNDGTATPSVGASNDYGKINQINVISSSNMVNWTDPMGNPLINNCPGVVWLFDPAVLVDSDGSGYLYYSYCTNWTSGYRGAAKIGYMTSKSTIGSFTYRGTCLDNPGAFFGLLVITGLLKMSLLIFQG